MIVPIEPWREIESEKETAYLLKSEAMKRRLLAAKNVKRESRLKKLVRSLEFDAAVFEGLAWWIEQDRQKTLRMLTW